MNAGHGDNHAADTHRRRSPLSQGGRLPKARPAHTLVPEHIRMIGQGRYSDACMVNWVSNVFPGILGRTCDRPCEPACRRGRFE